MPHLDSVARARRRVRRARYSSGVHATAPRHKHREFLVVVNTYCPEPFEYPVTRERRVVRKTLKKKKKKKKNEKEIQSTL